MTSTSGPQVADLVRRLRAWRVSSWRYGDRIELTRSALTTLAGLASASDGLPRPGVPDVGIHALADQLQVLTSDALQAGVDGDEIAAVLTDLERRLGLGRGSPPAGLR